MPGQRGLYEPGLLAGDNNAYHADGTPPPPYERTTQDELINPLRSLADAAAAHARSPSPIIISSDLPMPPPLAPAPTQAVAAAPLPALPAPARSVIAPPSQAAPPALPAAIAPVEPVARSAHAPPAPPLAPQPAATTALRRQRSSSLDVSNALPPPKRRAAVASDSSSDNEDEVEYSCHAHVFVWASGKGANAKKKHDVIHKCDVFAVPAHDFSSYDQILTLLAEQINCRTDAIDKKQLHYRYEKPASMVPKLLTNDLALKNLKLELEKKRQEVYFLVHKPVNWSSESSHSTAAAAEVSSAGGSSKQPQGERVSHMDERTLELHKKIMDDHPIGACVDHPDVHCHVHQISGLHFDVGKNGGLSWAFTARVNGDTKNPPLGNKYFNAKNALPSAAQRAAAAKKAVVSENTAPLPMAPLGQALPTPAPAPYPYAHPYGPPPSPHYPAYPYPSYPNYPAPYMPYGYPPPPNPYHPHVHAPPPPAPVHPAPSAAHHAPAAASSAHALRDLSNMSLDDYAAAGGLSSVLKEKLRTLGFVPSYNLASISSETATAAGFSFFEWEHLKHTDGLVRSQPAPPIAIAPHPLPVPAPAPLVPSVSTVVTPPAVAASALSAPATAQSAPAVAAPVAYPQPAVP
ncbi:hypothetical protein AURDEDRAFT_177873 [Auricularia subglabra TFB-10046 SS5]|uniref:Uncharacterized protein n=1 Tax=Auricularia subglabra (strain TFB-10046 / SS5) TaxID=717982 RepID=J0CS14_AURST|nr:hypothetical protein AURDEDRAFT_177873 [Auricularia subglabra TFB-10046 SS5]